MKAGRCLRWLVLSFAFSTMASANGLRGGAALAIVIDDMGYAYQAGLRALDLPGQITYAMLPYAPHSKQLAELAHQRDKEIILHLPMQAREAQDLGPGGLTLHMSEQQFKQSVNDSLDAVPYVKGINNHMGSLLTRHPGHMRWLMEVMHAHGNLYFVDSRTTTKTVAHIIAHELKVPHISRDVFLDATPHNKHYVKKELKRAIRLAKRQGFALAIAHPYVETLDVLQKELRKLNYSRVELVSVGALIEQVIASEADSNPQTAARQAPGVVHPTAETLTD